MNIWLSRRHIFTAFAHSNVAGLGLGLQCYSYNCLELQALISRVQPKMTAVMACVAPRYTVRVSVS